MKFFQKKIKLFLVILVISLIFFGGKKVYEKLNLSKSSSVLISPVDTKDFLENGLRGLGEEIRGTILNKGDYLVATISSGTTIYFNQEADYVKTLASLQLIFKNIRIEGRWPVKIDLRFSRPILGY